jgi:DNA-binding transcriptional regulator YhcF (GntR family)
MPKDQISAEKVSRALLNRISTGQFSPGDRMPTVRKMAIEIGSNRNTVNKAYQMLLDMGIIEYSDTRRKGFVVSKSDPLATSPKSRAELGNYFHRHSVDLIWQGMAAGMTADEILDQLKTAINEVFSNLNIKIIFFECNDYDTNEMGRSLNQVLKIPVEYKNLSEFYRNPDQIVDSYDIIITTYHHLAEITTRLSEHGVAAGRVIGIETRPTPDSMLKIARFTSPKIGVICTNQNTSHMLKHILYGYHPDWTVEATEVDQTENVQKLARECDHIIVTHTCTEQVTALTGRTPDVVAFFQIDEQSISFLQQRIHQIRMDNVKQGVDLVE